MKKPEFIQICIDAAVKAVISGQHTNAIKVLQTAIPPNQERRLKKRIKASEQWDLDGKAVYNPAGIAFSHIASWGGRFCIALNGHEYRFRLLCLDHFGRRTVYLLSVAGSIKGLPGVDLGDGELQALLKMADEISDRSSDLEHLQTLKNPLRFPITSRVDQWLQAPWNPSELLVLLESRTELLDILVAAIDSQLRGLKQLRHAPVGIYNFQVPKWKLAVENQLVMVLQAATFSNEESDEPGPIIVEDLDSWRNCYRRLVLIRASRREVIQPIIDALQVRNRLQKCDTEPASWKPTMPIIFGKNALCSRFAVDIELNQSEPLTFDQQHLLRTAASKTLLPKFASSVYQSWKVQKQGPLAYRLSGFAVWRRILAEHMLRVWFPDDAQFKRAIALCQASWQQQESDEQERKELLQRALELVTTPERYADRIMPRRPESKEEAEDKLSDEFFAFIFKPTKGEDAGQHFLAFSRDSLYRLLDTINFAPELHDAFLDVCDKRGVLNSRYRSITLGGKSFHGITFELEK